MIQTEQAVVCERPGDVDIPGIVAAHSESFVAAYRGLGEEALRTFVSDTRAGRFRARKLAEWSILVSSGYVARRSENGEVVGIAAAYTTGREQAYLDCLYLKPDYWSGHIGSRLLAMCLSELPWTTATLDTAVGTAAVGFFEQFGFEKTDDSLFYAAPPMKYGIFIALQTMQVERAVFDARVAERFEQLEIPQYKEL